VDDAPVHVSATDDVGQLHRGLRRLRAENERLARLLDLRGLEATPAPEQLAHELPLA
jgi:hypothetical protein